VTRRIGHFRAIGPRHLWKSKARPKPGFLFVQELDDLLQRARRKGAADFPVL
jgi:hypothetical protein